MALVPAKCPECGGNINIEADKRAAVCEFCKQPFVIEDAINNFNTTYNITNNNEIKANTVNVFNGDNLESKIKEYCDRISLTLKLNDRDRKLAGEMKEFYKFKEEHNESILVHEAFLETLLEEYYLALKGSRWGNFRDGGYHYYSRTLELLLNETEIICALDSQRGQVASEKVNEFFDALYSIIVTPVSETNSIDEIKGVYESKEGWPGASGQSTISIESLAWDFLMEEHYPESYREIYNSKIRPIIDAYKGHYVGYELIYGRFAVIPVYMRDEGYRTYVRDTVLLDISVTEISQVNELIQKNKNKLNPQTVYNLEEQKRTLEWRLRDKRCGACDQQLSFMGKCKNPSCEYYGKSIKEEIIKIGEKIRLAKS